MSVWLIDVVGCIVLVNTIYAADIYTRCYEEFCFTVESPRTPGSATKGDAEYDCHSFNATLLTITSARAQTNFEQFINDGMHIYSISSQLTVAWIKATRSPTSADWMWIIGMHCTDVISDQTGSQTIATSYAYLKIDSADTIYHATDPKTVWSAYVCEIYNVSEGTCTSAFNGHVLNGRCYWVGNNLVSGTWFNARNQCLLKGGDLASFDNVNSSSIRSLPWLTSTNYWIGLYRNKWTVGGGIDSEIKYTNWAGSNPNNFNYDCICINQPAWTWTQCGCGDGHSVICSNLSGSSNTPPINPSSASPTASITTITTRSSPPPTFATSTKSPSADTGNKEGTTDSLAIPIGVGVGVGGGVILIIIIIVIVVCLWKRKQAGNDAEKPTELVGNKSDSKKKEKKETKNNGHAIYATVSMKRDSTSPIVENEDPVVTNNSSLEYATLDFVNKQQH